MGGSLVFFGGGGIGPNDMSHSQRRWRYFLGLFTNLFGKQKAPGLFWNINSGSEKLGNGGSFGFSFKNQPKTGYPQKKDRSKCYHLIKRHTWAPPPKAQVPPNSSVSVQFFGPLLGRDKESKGKPRAVCFPGLQSQDWEVLYWGGTGQTLIC